MKQKEEKKVVRKTKIGISSVILYVGSAIVALVGVALLVDNIYIFRSTIDNYVGQGYPTDVVMKQIVPSQLLPGIFEPIGMYGGISFILFCLGKINRKVSEFLLVSKSDDSFREKESALEEDTANLESAEVN